MTKFAIADCAAQVLSQAKDRTLNLVDVYRYALRCQANAALLERARATKERKQRQRSIKRAEKRLFTTI